MLQMTLTSTRFTDPYPCKMGRPSLAPGPTTDRLATKGSATTAAMAALHGLHSLPPLQGAIPAQHKTSHARLIEGEKQQLTTNCKLRLKAVGSAHLSCSPERQEILPSDCSDAEAQSLPEAGDEAGCKLESMQGELQGGLCGGAGQVHKHGSEPGTDKKPLLNLGQSCMRWLGQRF